MPRASSQHRQPSEPMRRRARADSQYLLLRSVQLGLCHDSKLAALRCKAQAGLESITGTRQLASAPWPNRKASSASVTLRRAVSLVVTERRSSACEFRWQPAFRMRDCQDLEALRFCQVIACGLTVHSNLLSTARPSAVVACHEVSWQGACVCKLALSPSANLARDSVPPHRIMNGQRS